VLVRGAKWCGKTATAEQQAKSVLAMQDPDTYENNLMTARIKPSLLLEGPKPRLIDEWQVAPQLWDAVRFAVDKAESRGQFVLTGSATPLRPEDRPLHSGTGRFSFLTMRPMSLFESGDSNGSVSLKSLFDGVDDLSAIAETTVDHLAYLVCRGGWPTAVVEGGDAALETAYDYVDAVAEEDISHVDGVMRNAAYARLVLQAYARCTAVQADLATIRSTIKAQKGELSRGTVDSYLAALRALFVIEDLPAWTPSLRSKARITTTPTRHLVDPSLAAAALGASPSLLLKDLPTMGLLFESLVVRDLRVYAEALKGTVFHYRDATGLEVDAVVVLRDGRWGLVEVKMGQSYVDEGARNLLKVAAKIDQDVMGAPSFLAVVTPGGYAFRRPDGVFVVPVGCLKP
jgi:predicted AAA+ superfamily ATPase